MSKEILLLPKPGWDGLRILLNIVLSPDKAEESHRWPTGHRPQMPKIGPFELTWYTPSATLDHVTMAQSPLAQWFAYGPPPNSVCSGPTLVILS